MLFGSSGWLSSSGDQSWHQASPGITGSAEAGDRFADTLATGDYDGDGFADLAVGVTGEAIGSDDGAGMANVIYGSSSKLTSSGDQGWHQDSSGIAGGSEPGDRFSTGLA